MAVYPELKGKNAIVTGGTTGIGEAIAHDLASNGVNVMVVESKNKERAENVVAALRDRGVTAVYALVDLRSGEGVAEMMAQAREVARNGITVNCTNPATTRSARARGIYTAETVKALEEKAPMNTRLFADTPRRSVAHDGRHERSRL